jgi:hypothetical protein
MSFLNYGPGEIHLGRLGVDSDTVLGAIRTVYNKGDEVVGHVATEGYDGTWRKEIKVFNDTGGALVVGDCYHLTVAGGLEAETPKVIAWTDAGNDNFRDLVVATEAIADQAYGWVCFAGTVDAHVEGTTDVAVGDFLMLDTNSAAGVTALITSGGAVETNSTVAVAQEAQATAGVATKAQVFLLGKSKICDTQ